MELATGDICVVGTSTRWSDHTAAVQHWQGDRSRVLYQDQEGEHFKLVAVNPDGSDVHEYSHDLVFHNTGCDGRYSFGRSTIQQLWPRDTVAPGHNIGLFRLDHDTGACDLIASLDDILDLHPRRKDAGHCHLMVVQVVTHATLPRVLFALHNAEFHRVIGEEPYIKSVYSINADGSDLRYVGEYGDHPNWHPTEDRILSNMPGFPKGRAFGLFSGDGGEPIAFIPGCDGGGHPSFRPDGRSIVTDRYGVRDGEHRMGVALCDVERGGEVVLADFPNPCHTKAYHHAIRNRPDGAYWVDVLSSIRTPHPPLVTQAHPAWSRDGRFVLFNGDDTGGSQLYLIDVDTAMKEAGR